LNKTNDIIRFWIVDNQKYWLKYLTIALVLSLSVLLGWQNSLRFSTLILGGLAAIFLLRWQVLGLLLMIPIGFLVPFSLGTGTETSINATILLLVVLFVLWILDTLVNKRQLLIEPISIYLPLILFCAVVLIAFLFGQLEWFYTVGKASLASQLGGVALFLLSVGAFVLYSQQIKEQIWLERLTWLFLFFGGFFILMRAFPAFGHQFTIYFQTGSTGSPFWIWMVALSASQALLNKDLDNRFRFLLGGITLATLWVGLFPNRSWASGWLPPIIALIVIVVFWKPRLGYIIAIIFGISFVLNYDRIIALVLSEEQYSWITRLAAWKILLEIISVNPIFGLGPSNYYFYTPLYPILNWFVNFSSHNQYIDLIAQIGFFGFFCFTFFILRIILLGINLINVKLDGFSHAYVIGVLGGLGGTLAAGMLGDWIIPFVYNIGFTGFRSSILVWIFLGGLVALRNFNNSPGNPVEF
jgi:O-antigen ligase